MVLFFSWIADGLLACMCFPIEKDHPCWPCHRTSFFVPDLAMLGMKQEFFLSITFSLVGQSIR